MRRETDAEKAAGNTFVAFYICALPVAGLLAWFLSHDPNMSFDSDGLPIISQVATFLAYFILMMIGFFSFLVFIFGGSIFYYGLRRWCSSLLR